MSTTEPGQGSSLVRLEEGVRVFDAIFTVAPLVVVGTRDADGAANLAPKHMAMPIGWSDRYCFACTPRHRTHQNAVRTGEFTVSFATPDLCVLVGQAAATRRRGDAERTELGAFDTSPAEDVDGVLISDGHAALECRLERIVEEGDESLIIGRIVAAHVNPKALRSNDRDDADVVFDDPLTAYVAPGRLARIDRTTAFPYPARFSI